MSCSKALYIKSCLDIKMLQICLLKKICIFDICPMFNQTILTT